jgi:hypothetical protein
MHSASTLLAAAAVFWVMHCINTVLTAALWVLADNAFYLHVILSQRVGGP